VALDEVAGDTPRVANAGFSAVAASFAARIALFIAAAIADWRADRGDGSDAKRMAGTAFAIRVVSAGILYLGQVLLARWMGRFEFGIYVYAWAWVGFIGMASPLGIAYSAQRFIPEYRTRGDLDGLRGFLVGSRLLCLGFGLAAGVAMAGTALALGDRMPDYYVVPLLLAALTLPIFTVSSVQDSVARAFNWIGLALIPGFVSHPLLVLAATCALYFVGATVTATATLAIASVAFLAVVLVQGALLKRRVAASVPPGRRRYEPLYWLRTALPLFLVDSFFLMLTYVDTLILQLFVGPGEIAIYYSATKTLALVNFIYFAVAAASAHRFSEYHVAGDHGRLARFLADTMRWTFWPSLAFGIVLLALGRPILALFGPGFVDGYPLMCIMLVGLLARAAMGPSERLLNMIGQQKICAAIYGTAFAVNLGLCLALIPHFGLFGAAAATASAVLTESALLFAVVRNRLGFRGAPAAT
jgi:O-antigen/teichoic acid export membrane protein